MINLDHPHDDDRPRTEEEALDRLLDDIERYPDDPEQGETK